MHTMLHKLPRHSTGTDPRQQTDAKAAFRLTDSAFRMHNVPVIVSVPGRYTFMHKMVRQKRHLSSLKVVHQAGIAVHGGCLGQFS